MSAVTELQEQELQSHEEAVQLANEINRLEAALKQMKDDLKTYVKTHGRVDTGDEVWDFYQSVSWKFDRNHLKELAGEMAMEGIDPWEMLTISKATLNKLGWEEQRLSQLGTKKVTQRFTSRKN
ncbi:hypothetical protein [Lentibacillus sp. CBA3610]|uniref:hypothetical protein n=1 Tax=Lentibacillus sp. CBA3610 TaxID=2518176 RepID=UPI00159597D4|nr:hypothetical protein [Lentibacillus sp. CBA3610]QKY69349.1 hypothetical protein Len3610_06830 [Lentibacillus sp. CBA3610]